MNDGLFFLSWGWGKDINKRNSLISLIFWIGISSINV
jgi:hypothetical protein